MFCPVAMPRCSLSLVATSGQCIAQFLTCQLRRRVGLITRCVSSDVREHADVVIIGSGPVGAAFANKLVKAGKNVSMYDGKA